MAQEIKKRVLCAMSGGVDSSVAAALLKKQGFEVIGVFMKLWAEETPSTDLVRENICCSVEAATASRAVCDKLKIPFYVVNLEKEFKKSVVDYYIKEYASGRTPNPCVICNRDIKGEVLLKKALEMKADYLATGHYARVNCHSEQREESLADASISNKLRDSSPSAQNDILNYYLYQSVDKTKDQTYFLWTLTQEQLSKVLFPVGDYTKVEVRKMAYQMGLPTAERKESQGICFIPDRDVCGFLRRHAQQLTKPGEIVDVKGNKLGIHNGLVNYTVGQRERLGLGGPKAYYVIQLKSRENKLVVGEESDLYERRLTASNLNWLGAPTFGQRINNLQAKIRYRHPAENCRFDIIAKDKMEVIFSKPQRAVTPGQSVVFYSGEKVLGGGVIN